MLSQFYINLLKGIVSHQSRSACGTLDKVMLFSFAYILEFRKLIGKRDARRLSAIPSAIQLVYSVIPTEQKNKEIIFVGRMATEKALFKLLKIWEMIQDELPDWKFTFVGNGPRFGTCRQTVGEKELKRVRLTGHQISIPYIDRARTICLTSVIEGSPTVFTEAMSLGVIPIGFDSFNAVYGMTDGGVGRFIIPNNNYRQYTVIILRLAGDDILRYRIVHKAQIRENRYDIEHVNPSWMNISRRHGLV